MKTEKAAQDSKVVNNDYYHDLGERWYKAKDDPIALLRAESKLRNSWIGDTIQKHFPKAFNVLDVGCGAGFLSNHLAVRGFQVTGIDLSESSLTVAKNYDETKSVEYINADAYALPFPDESFDVVTSTDFLEHVSDPQQVVKEISRVLKPGGIFFFHTFNKNRLAHLIVIKGVEWFVKNTPPKLHTYDMFISPRSLTKWLLEADFAKPYLRGCRPKLNTAFFKMLLTREVPENFKFKWTKSTMISYTGWTRKLNA
ncbi:MAG: bifunctional 2-polyprenyl-6-hydroxyphenol methylase/3-demethylubiquinol 3-O-methyltransferase UbiG [Bdellovibrionota bacterium]